MTRYTIKQYEINTIINCFNYHSEMYIRFAQIVCKKKKNLHRYDKAQSQVTCFFPASQDIYIIRSLGRERHMQVTQDFLQRIENTC